MVPIKVEDFFPDLKISQMLLIPFGVGEFESSPGANFAPKGGVDTNCCIKLCEGCMFSLFDLSSSSKGPIPANKLWEFWSCLPMLGWGGELKRS